MSDPRWTDATEEMVALVVLGLAYESQGDGTDVVLNDWAAADPQARAGTLARIRPVLAALADAGLLVPLAVDALDGAAPPSTSERHVYTSTACWHAREPGREHLHDECKTDGKRWDGTEKIAATCKHCLPPGSGHCRCGCHSATAGEEASDG